MSKAVMWSIRRPHTDNIKNGNKWDEIRKRIPQNLTSETINYIYETKSNGGCGKVIGEFRVSNKTYIYAEIGSNGTKHLYNTAFIMPALSDEDLFNYLYDSKENSGWALRISDLVIYDTPKDLGEFSSCYDCFNLKNIKLHRNLITDKIRGNYSENSFCAHCCKYYNHDFQDCMKQSKPLTRPPQSWCYVEEI